MLVRIKPSLLIPILPVHFLAGPSLRVVSTMSVGYGNSTFSAGQFASLLLIEHVNLPALAKRGIRLGITPGVLTDAGGCL